MTDEWQRKEVKVLVTPHHLLMVALICLILFGGIAYFRFNHYGEFQGWRTFFWISLIVATVLLDVGLQRIDSYRSSFMNKPIGSKETGPKN